MRKLFTEFPLHIPGLYRSTPYLLKYKTVVQVSVKLGIMVTCKTECKGLFHSGKAYKHHRTLTLCKLTTSENTITYHSTLKGCVRLGNPDLDFQNPDFGFTIEREIRKRISTLRYLLLDFHFYRSIGKSKKGFEKLFLRTAVLHAHA